MFDESVERQSVYRLAWDLRDAWNRGDAAGYASLFSGDADFVAWNGIRGRGRAVIEEGHRRLFDGPLAGSRMILTLDDADSANEQPVRFVRPDVAVMVTSGAVILPGQEAADHESVQTFVLAREHGRWQVTAFHNTRLPARRPPE